MSFSAVTPRGTASERTSDTSIAVSPGTAIAVGQLAFLTTLGDNISTTTGASTDHSVADSVGNTWTKAFEYTYSPGGAANDGMTVSVWYTVVETEIGTGATVTTTFGSAILSKTTHLGEATIGAGNTISVEAFGTDTADAGAALASMTSREYLLLGGAERENEDVAMTEDADYTTLSETISSTAGATATNVALGTSYRIATLTSDNYLPTVTGSGDRLHTLVALYEVAGGPPTFTGSGAPTLADATSAGTGDYTPPPITGSGAPSLSGATASGAATFDPPVFSGAGTPSLEGATASGAGTFTPASNDVTGSGSPTLEDATSAGSGTHVGPTITGSGAPTLADATAAGTGTFVAPVFTGSGAPTLSDAVSAGSGLWIPVITGSGAIVLEALLSTGEGDHSAGLPTRTGSGSPVLEDLVSAGHGFPYDQNANNGRGPSYVKGRKIDRFR
jgi:hypothetical protein